MSRPSTIKRALISAVQDLPFFLLIYEVLNYWLIAIHLSYLKSNLSFTALSNIRYYWNLTVNETGLFVLSVQFNSVTQLCPILCDPMNCSMLGFAVLHYLPEFAQTHVHWFSDVIQQFNPLLSPSPALFPSIRVFSNESGDRGGSFFCDLQICLVGRDDPVLLKFFSVVRISGSGWFLEMCMLKPLDLHCSIC